MHRGQGVRLRCFCLVIFFLVGVFGNSMEKKSAPPRDAWTEAGIEAQTAGAAFQTRPGAQWLPVDSLHGIDDFHTLLDAAGTMAQNTLRAAPFLLLPAVLVFLSGIPLAARRRLFGEKKISVFCVVSFIHWTDGKKKPCF